jgi:type VI secretion system protein ImpC
MSAEAELSPARAAEATTTEFSLLDQAISATKQTEPDQAQLLLKTLTEEALKGTVTFSKNLTITFNKAISLIDEQLSKQLAAILHHPEFTKFEGSWRGLHHLVMNTETGASLKIKMLNISKKELARDLAKAVDFDQSDMFKRIYENEFGMAGGEPYGALIGDYEFSNHRGVLASVPHRDQSQNVRVGRFPGTQQAARLEEEFRGPGICPLALLPRDR